MDVGEPLRPDRPDSRVFQVGNPFQEPVTITLALINHRPGWTAGLTPSVLINLPPGATAPVTLTVQPPSWDGLADELPVVDIEAYVDGRLIGGIRKLAKPPIPLHKPQDRPYAETEISVEPLPIRAGLPHTITAVLVNTGPESHSVRAEFSVANFGFGIPFTDTNIIPAYQVITLTPGFSGTVWARWTPPFDGHWCIRVALVDPAGEYPTQYSQRNVDVVREPFRPCQPFTRDFRLENPTSLAVTVTLGSNAINLPAGWTYSTNITETVLGPYQGITVTLTITPPCTTGAAATMLAPLDTGGASGPPTIDVEGYVDGQLLGGIQVQLERHGAGQDLPPACHAALAVAAAHKQGTREVDPPGSLYAWAWRRPAGQYSCTVTKPTAAETSTSRRTSAEPYPGDVYVAVPKRWPPSGMRLIPTAVRALTRTALPFGMRMTVSPTAAFTRTLTEPAGRVMVVLPTPESTSTAVTLTACRSRVTCPAPMFTRSEIGTCPFRFRLARRSPDQGTMTTLPVCVLSVYLSTSFSTRASLRNCSLVSAETTPVISRSRRRAPAHAQGGRSRADVHLGRARSVERLAHVVVGQRAAAGPRLIEPPDAAHQHGDHQKGHQQVPERRPPADEQIEAGSDQEQRPQLGNGVPHAPLDHAEIAHEQQDTKADDDDRADQAGVTSVGIHCLTPPSSGDSR